MVKKLDENMYKSIADLQTAKIDRPNGCGSYANSLKLDQQIKKTAETSTINDHATNDFNGNGLLNEFQVNVSHQKTQQISKFTFTKPLNHEPKNDLNSKIDSPKKASVVNQQLKSSFINTPDTDIEIECSKKKVRTVIEESTVPLNEMHVLFYIKNIVNDTLKVEFEEKSLKFKFKTTDTTFMRTHFADFDQLKAKNTNTRITNGTINGAPTADNQFSPLKPEIDACKLPIFKFEITQLFDKIIPDECSYELKENCLMFKIKKKIPMKWGTLEMATNEMGTNFLANVSNVQKMNDSYGYKSSFRNVNKLINGYEKITNNINQQVDSESSKDEISIPTSLSPIKNYKSYQMVEKNEPKNEEQDLNNMLTSLLQDANPNESNGENKNTTPVKSDNDSQTEIKPSSSISLKLNLAELKGKIGYTGLNNLGNTCYMNSCVQCLSNTAELRDYFLSEQYKEDLNKDNPFGSGGNLAEAFSEVLYKLWSGNSACFSPQRFKRLIDENCSQFIGFSQHDSVEFMEHFLDVLHEDLNKVDRKKIQPAQPIENEDQLNDEQLANEQWKRHIERNNSIMTKLFYGQYKSKLVCPTCSKVSIVFDPFLYLPIPLTKNKITLNCYVFSLDINKPPKRMSIKLPQGSKIINLLEDLAEKTGINSDEMIVCQINQSGELEKEFKKTQFITDELSKSKKIYVYQKPSDRFINKCIIHQTIQDLNFGEQTIENLLKNHPMSVCSWCNKNLTRVKSKEIVNCSKCKKILYCSEACRENNDPLHESKCHNEPVVVGWPSFYFFDIEKINYDELMTKLERLASKSAEVIETEIDESEMVAEKTKDESNELHVGREIKEGQLDLEMSEVSEIHEKEVEESEEMNVCTPEELKDDLLPNGQVDSKENIMNGMNNSDEQEADAKDQVSDSKYRFVLKGKTDDLSQKTELIYVPKDESLEEQIKFRASLRLFYFLYVDWKAKYSRIDENGKRRTFALSVHSRNLNLIASGDKVSTFNAEETTNEIKLEDLMTKFTEPETLSAQDSWVCPKCKEPRTASKELTIWRPPQILIIQLKRFSYSSYVREKIDKLVSYPVKGLDISKFCADSKLLDQANKPIYDLYAVIQHFGNLYGGHYTAIANTTVEDRELGWRSFNDSSVRSLDEESSVSKSAYVLFYRLRGSAASSNGLDHD